MRDRSRRRQARAGRIDRQRWMCLVEGPLRWHSSPESCRDIGGCSRPLEIFLFSWIAIRRLVSEDLHMRGTMRQSILRTSLFSSTFVIRVVPSAYRNSKAASASLLLSACFSESMVLSELSRTVSVFPVGLGWSSDILSSMLKHESFGYEVIFQRWEQERQREDSKKIKRG